jgi:Domain of Unknown Function with PDB structure (DUF3857)
MRIGILVLLTFATFPALSRNTVDSTSDSLTVNANAVINKCHITYEVKSPTDIRKTTLYKATVLNQSGRKYGIVRTIVDNQSKITSFSGTVSKTDGTIIDKIKQSDLIDVPSYPDFVFASDDRVCYYEPVIQDYPYTLEYEATVAYSGLIAFDTWAPIDNTGLSCDTASYTIVYPEDYKIRYKSFNIPGQPAMRKVDGNRSLISWSIGDFAAIEINNFIPPLETFLPIMMVMPEKFFFDGYYGEVSDAKTYGSWVSGLIKDRGDLNPGIKARMAALTADAAGTREKVSRVYRFLQENTRYVAVTYGIGGIQPAPADKVSQYGYGDCKGLSNYMKALLSSVGIKSYYTEIGNGRKRIEHDDYTYLETNHVILCVPDGNDTIWLECTSPYYNAGYTGYSNSNRKALLVTENGGILVNTPRADSTNSYRMAKYELDIRPDGSSAYKIIEESTGHYYEDRLYLKNVPSNDALRYLYRDLPLTNHEITSFAITPDTSKLAKLTTTIDGNLSKYGTVAGKRLIVPAVPWRLFRTVPKIEADRKADIFFYEHTACSDTVIIKIPDGYTITTKDLTREFSNEIGRYRQSVSLDGSSLCIIRDIVIPSGSYPAESREKVTEFYKKSQGIEAMSIMCELAK